MAKCYSLYEEAGYLNDLKEVIEDFINNYPIDYPFNLDIYVGDEVTFKPSNFLPDLYDEVESQVNAQCGEWSEDWVETLRSNTKKLQEDFEKWFDAWCKEKEHPITFWNVENTKRVTYVVKAKDCWEELPNG